MNQEELDQYVPAAEVHELLPDRDYIIVCNSVLPVGQMIHLFKSIVKNNIRARIIRVPEHQFMLLEKRRDDDKTRVS